MNRQAAGRRKLVLVAGLFALPLLAALALRLGGWAPSLTRNHGQLLAPPVALDDLALQQADGSPYHWRPAERIFRVAVLAPEGCAGDCAARLDLLERVWQAQGRHADQFEVLWFGVLPTGAEAFPGLVPMAGSRAGLAAVRDRLPYPAGAAALYVVDPRGFLILAYPPGFDPNGLRKDLARMLK
ncbi:MAG TPA: hypothetical protein VFG21_10780 [Xanthomonadaceae bacterium]|nr:hypothetical protein [Xanthomonadaceae bacterium]